MIAEEYAQDNGDPSMSLIYLELARLADDDRARAYAPEAAARRRAARLRAAALCCQRSIMMRLSGALAAARGRLAPRAAATVCC